TRPPQSHAAAIVQEWTSGLLLLALCRIIASRLDALSSMLAMAGAPWESGGSGCARHSVHDDRGQQRHQYWHQPTHALLGKRQLLEQLRHQLIEACLSQAIHHAEDQRDRHRRDKNARR